MDRRRARRCVRWTGIGLVVLVVVVLALTRTPITRAIVVARLEASLGLEVSASSAVVEPDGSILVRDAVVRLPSVRGPAGRALAIDRCRLRLDWGRVLRDGPAARRVELVSPTVRASFERGSGRVSLEALGALLDHPVGSGPIPEIIAERATIELGEHESDGDYQTLKRVLVDGRFVPSPEGEGYIVSVRERADGRGARGRDDARLPLRATGRITERGATVAIDRIDLDNWGPSSLPSEIRDVVAMLDVRGQVRETRISYESGVGVTARVEVSGVGMNLPFDAEGRYTPDTELARMREVSGTIELSPSGFRAELDGVLEDLPYHASLEYAGTELDSPFECQLVTRDFRLSEHPEFVPFAPPEIGEQLEAFSNPTARVDARVTIRREPPRRDRASPVEVSGWLEISEGAATFVGFPYPFEGLSGALFFDTERVEIRLAGRNPRSGTRLEVEGTVEPPTPEARVDLQIEAHEMPIDAVLKRAMGDQAALLNELIAEELMPAGLADGSGGSSFRTGGTGGLSISVRRAPGPESNWTWQAEASFPSLGVVPEAFPLAMTGRDVRLRIDESSVELVEGRFEPATGGEVALSFESELDADADARRTRVEADATGLALDPMLLDAVEHAMDTFGAGGLTTLRDAREHLASSGRLDAQLTFEQAGRGEPMLDLSARPRQVRLDVREADPAEPLTLESIDGEIGVSGGGVSADLTGVIASGQRRGEFSLAGDVPFGSEERTELTIVLPSFDAGIRFEELIAAFSAPAGREVAELRARYEPAARGDAIVVLREEGGRLVPRVEIDRLARAGVTTEVGRVRTEDAEGSLEFELGRGVVFGGFSAPLTIGSEGDDAAGPRITLDGILPVGGELAEATETEGQRRSLSVEVEGLALDSSLARWLVERAGGERGVEMLGAADVAGLVDLSLETWVEGGSRRFEGEIRPRRLAFDRGQRRVRFERIDGAVRVGDGGVDFESVVARAEGATLAVDGRYTPRGGSDAGGAEGSLGGRFLGSIDLDATSLTPDARALIPEALTVALDSIVFDAGGAVMINASEIDLELDEGGGVRRAAARGWASFSGASADAGVGIGEAEGSLRFEVSASDGEGATITIDLDAGSLRLEGVRVTEASAELANGDEPGEVLVRDIRADCYGGRLGGDAELRRGVRLSGEPGTHYDLRVLASDVRLKPVLDDLGGGGGVGASDGSGGRSGGSEAPDASRGLLSGELSLGGWIGTDESIRGRGAIRVSDGRVLNMPLLMPVLEVGSLQLPVSGRVDLALTRFYVEDERVILGELLALATSVELFGYGSMHWPTREIDLWVDTRGRRRLPIVGRLIEGVRNELVTTRVTGTLGDPSVRISPLRGTRGFVERILTGEPTPDEQRLVEIRRRAQRLRGRVRAEGERMREPEIVAPIADAVPTSRQ